MLVTFTTKAYADIIMFGDVALALLKMIGHSANRARRDSRCRCAWGPKPAKSRYRGRKNRPSGRGPGYG